MSLPLRFWDPSQYPSVLKIHRCKTGVCRSSRQAALYFLLFCLRMSGILKSGSWSSTHVLGHELCGDVSSWPCWRITEKSTWAAFWKNCFVPKVSALRLSDKCSLLNRCERPLLIFRNTRRPWTGTCFLTWCMSTSGLAKRSIHGIADGWVTWPTSQGSMDADVWRMPREFYLGLTICGAVETPAGERLLFMVGLTLLDWMPAVLVLILAVLCCDQVTAALLGLTSNEGTRPSPKPISKWGSFPSFYWAVSISASFCSIELWFGAV